MKETAMPQTPYFEIKKEELDQNVNDLLRALDQEWGKSIFSYSVKTNSLPWLLRYIKDCGAWAEVVSSDEYRLARCVGFPQNRIVFNGPVKGKEEFLDALRNGAILNLDSEREIRWMEEEKAAEPRSVGLRVNFSIEDHCPGDIGWEEDGTRFGFNYENGELGRAIERIQAVENLRVGGLHMHVSNPKRGLNVYRELAAMAAKIVSEYGLQADYIDIGGSFFGGVPGKTTFQEYVSAIRQELETTVDPQKTALIVEPGSAIIASVVDFVTTVVDVKDTAKSRMVTVDGSRCNIDPLLLKQNYLYDIETEGTVVYPGKQIVCGFTCMDKDRIIEPTNITELREGDRLVFHRVGAYTMQMNPLFISFYPAVYVRDGNLTCVRKAWTAEDFMNER